MGNANGREDQGQGGSIDINVTGSAEGDGFCNGSAESAMEASNSMNTTSAASTSTPNPIQNLNHSPPHPLAPAPRSTSPLLFAPQVPVAPLRSVDGPSSFNQMWQNESHGVLDHPSEKGIPTIITWNYGGNDVAVEGSWDNWRSRKKLQRSGKDHSIVMVLPSGIYHYKFIVDGERRYIPDLPFVADEMGHVCNLLDVHDYVPENTDNVVEFETPPSPDSTYSQAFPAEEDFAKEPVVVPPQLHLTVLGMENSEATSSSKPQHVVLNHLFIEKGWASQSVVALGLSHRFQSKYVTVCLYKPLKRSKEKKG